MISCTEFILAYNELFKYIEERGGREGLEDFWTRISDEFLFNLDELVRTKGIKGMEEYWGHTLTEEAANARIYADGKEFRIEMDECPSVKRINESGVKKCSSYCDHCKALYKRIIDKYGFEYSPYIIDADKGVCCVKVRKID